jgi:hypothetical protein
MEIETEKEEGRVLILFRRANIRSSPILRCYCRVYRLQLRSDWEYLALFLVCSFLLELGTSSPFFSGQD